MKYYYKLYTLVIFICLFGCNHQNEIKTQLVFESLQQKDKSLEEDSWCIEEGNANIDEKVRYGQQNSLMLQSQSGDSIKKSKVFYFTSCHEIDVDEIIFEGKYKFKNAENASISFDIEQYTNSGDIIKNPLTLENSNGESDWNSFSTKATIDTKAMLVMFSVITVGDIQLWISNCKSTMKGQNLIINSPKEEDNEFDEGSNIVLQALSPQMEENLEVLGKVWGFLKYYHPEVARGNWNWNYELFRVLPSIAEAKDKAERDRLLNKWIDKYGKIKETEEYTISDESKYSRIINLDWISDNSIFDEALIVKLNTIRNAKRSEKYNHYVLEYMPRRTNKTNEREAAYKNIKWDDQGFRILTLYKLWNTMEYCFPYIEMTDKPWASLLKEYVPQFVTPGSKADYISSLFRLVANIDDSHGYLYTYTSSKDLEGTALSRTLAVNTIPVKLIAAKNEEIVVKSSQIKELQRGDVVLKIDDVPVNDIIDEFAPHIAASNRATLLRNILPHLVRTNKNALPITFLREGREMNTLIKQFEVYDTQHSSGVKSWKDYNLSALNIAYIDIEKAGKEEIEDIMKNNADAKGLILDMRKYPNMESYSTLHSLLTPRAETFMWFSFNDKLAPGNFKYISDSKIGKDNPNYFKGKVAILVDEGTQSHGEFSSMAYRMAPKSAIIGSITAGADGNVAKINLPCNMQLTYTALGAYYPNWEQCQRVGVKIDIKAHPTTQEIKNGQDVWIEKAIDYILN